MARGIVRTAAPTVVALLFSALAGRDAPAQGPGVTLYSGTHRTGASQSFRSDVGDLDDTRFGANRAASVSVAPGCRAILFEHRGYRGRSLELTDDDNDLGNTRLGRGSVSSMRVECRGGPGGGWGGSEWGSDGPRGRGITLYRDRDRTGPWQAFDRDVPELSRTNFGARRASSVDVSPGCVATLYSEAYYRGRSTTFREADNDLSNTPVGEDAASSLRVECRGGGPRPPDPVSPERPRGRGATLFRDRSLSGPYETFSSDVPDLSRSRIGSRTASSVDVSPGCVATLYSEPHYRGRTTTFREADNDLSNTPVGEDTASSVRVSCR